MKLMNMYKVSNPKEVIDKLYVSKNEGGRELAITEDSVDALERRLHQN